MFWLPLVLRQAYTENGDQYRQRHVNAIKLLLALLSLLILLILCRPPACVRAQTLVLCILSTY